MSTTVRKIIQLNYTNAWHRSSRSSITFSGWLEISSSLLCLQIFHGRITDRRSAKPWDFCFVSKDFYSPLAVLLISHFVLKHKYVKWNPFSLHPFSDHILEHSEDDTKSLFVIIKVSEHFTNMLPHMQTQSCVCKGLKLSITLSADHQWPHAVSRYSQERLWLALEELHSC